MVARITFPDEILKALNYHEQKVNKGVAECLLAENFLLDTNQLKFYDKLNRFKSQLELNTTVKTTLLHASLNFDPSETISKDELIQIATTYMNKIGFSDQPYLVYQHEDAGHPHIHILTTTIKDNGLPIYVHNIGRNQSQKARDEIENEFGLIKASSRNNNRDNDIPPVNIEKAIYGKSETKRSIINVLDAVINQYKYTSIAELNAVLQLGNVTADRGKEGGRIHRNAGLVYRVLDQAGNKIGKPIKASSIYSQPTLAKLEIKFNANKLRKVPSRNSLKKVVTNNLDISTSMTDFIANLKRQKIDTTIRRNDSGFIYGITFVDHNSKCVFNGRELDKKLSAAAIQQKFTFAAAPLQNNPVGKTRTESKAPYNKPQQDPVTRSIPREFSFDVFKEPRKSHNDLIKQFDLLKQLLQIEKSFNQTPFDLTRKKKRKKKKKSQNS